MSYVTLHLYPRYGRQTVPVLQNNLPHRFMSSGAIPAPTFEGDDKLYAPKIQQIVKEISQLTLLEVADLNELLKVSLIKVTFILMA